MHKLSRSRSVWNPSSLLKEVAEKREVYSLQRSGMTRLVNLKKVDCRTPLTGSDISLRWEIRGSMWSFLSSFLKIWCLLECVAHRCRFRALKSPCPCRIHAFVSATFSCSCIISGCFANCRRRAAGSARGASGRRRLVIPRIILACSFLWGTSRYAA